ncbi:MAG: hypothetical protein QW356_04655 [Candidatus Hadarchaeales archaeon]
MRVEEVAEILGLYRILPPPAHILLTHERITDGGIFAGLQPKGRGDIVVLGGDASPETVIHETLHTMGFGEELAYPLAQLMVVKYEVVSKFPLLKQLLTRPVSYRKCDQICKEFELAHTKYAGRVEHWVRE